MMDIPRIIGFRLATDDPNEPVWTPLTEHLWSGEVAPLAHYTTHTYDSRCAICRFAVFPEARDAVLAAAQVDS